ncbi:hypothetical protein FACS189437_04590 [Bacteroidia bacterium]|nr:hypothetical protein FACS189437_04590 [Bacteroidia bacterium]
MLEKIGNDAGRVWSVLSEKGSKSIKDLKKLLKVTDKEIYAAIGWLSREEKLIFNEKDDDLYLSLKR